MAIEFSVESIPRWILQHDQAKTIGLMCHNDYIKGNGAPRTGTTKVGDHAFFQSKHPDPKYNLQSDCFLLVAYPGPFVNWEESNYYERPQ